MQQPQWTIRGLIIGIVVAMVTIAAIPGVARADDAARQQFIFAYKLLQQGEDNLSADAFDQYLGNFPHAQLHADGLYFRALLYHRAGKDEQAEKLLAKADKPKFVPGYAIKLLRGQVLTDLKKYDDAVKVLETIDPEGLKPAVGQALWYLKGLAYRGAGNLQAAATSLAKAGEGKTPTAGGALLDLARVQVAMKSKSKAINTLSRAVKFDGVAAEAARLAGDLCYDEGNYEKSITFYKQVISDHQSSMDFQPAVLGVLWSHYSAGRYEAAIDAYERYRKMLTGGNATTAAYLAGSSQKALAHNKQAEPLLRQAADGAAPQDRGTQAKALYKLAQCQMAMENYNAIEKTVAQLRQRFPTSPVTVDAAFLQARADAAQGDVAAGAAILTRLINQGKDTPYYADAVRARARLYADHSELKAAASDFETYVSLKQIKTSDRQEARLRLVDLDYRLKRFDKAAAQANTLLAGKKLDPAVAQEGLYREAMALIKLGKTKQALATLQTLDETYPLNTHHADSVYYRGLLQMSLNQTHAGEALLQQAADEASLGQALRLNALGLIATQRMDDDNEQAAGKALEQMLKLGGPSALSNGRMLILAKTRIVRGDAQGALALAKTVVNNRGSATVKQQAYGLYLMGEAQRALGNTDAAVKSFRHVIAIGQGHELEASLSLAKALAAAGKNDAAINELDGLVNVASDKIASAALFEQAKIYRKLASQHRRASEMKEAKQAETSARKQLSRLVLLYSVHKLAPLPEQARVVLAEVDRQLDLKDAAARQWKALIDDYADSPYATYARAEQSNDPGERKALLGKLTGQKLDAFLTARVNSALNGMGGGS